MDGKNNKEKFVTILILIDGFLQCEMLKDYYSQRLVTILILIDGFLQSNIPIFVEVNGNCHNPYFNRWFSAIWKSEYDYSCKFESQSLF